MSYDNYRDYETQADKRKRHIGNLKSQHTVEQFLLLFLVPIFFVCKHLPAAFPACIATYYTEALFAGVDSPWHTILLIFTFVAFTTLFWQIIKALHNLSETASNRIVKIAGLSVVKLYVFSAYALTAWLIARELMPAKPILCLLIGAGVGLFGYLFYLSKIKNDVVEKTIASSILDNVDSLTTAQAKELHAAESKAEHTFR